jgi:hypothetical protein
MPKLTVMDLLEAKGKRPLSYVPVVREAKALTNITAH